MQSLNLPPCCHITLPYIMRFDFKISTKEFKPHVHMHHVVIIVISVTTNNHVKASWHLSPTQGFFIIQM